MQLPHTTYFLPPRQFDTAILSSPIFRVIRRHRHIEITAECIQMVRSDTGMPEEALRATEKYAAQLTQ
jgi:hypothetical protein